MESSLSKKIKTVPKPKTSSKASIVVKKPSENKVGFKLIKSYSHIRSPSFEVSSKPSILKENPLLKSSSTRLSNSKNRDNSKTSKNSKSNSFEKNESSKKPKTALKFFNSVNVKKEELTKTVFPQVKG